MAAHQHDQTDLECSICLELLCEPMQLPCSHVFCRRCLAGMVQQNRHCALCRATIPAHFDPIVAPLHQPLEHILMRQCTVEYMQRMDAVAFEAAHLVRLRIGNKYDSFSVCPRPKHQWTVEVELEAQPESCLPRGAELPDLIKHVRFGLPPACRVLSCGSETTSEAERQQKAPRYMEANEAPFLITATSPMSCTVSIIITWQDWIGKPPLRLEHELDFKRDGGSWDYGVDLHAAFTGSSCDEGPQVVLQSQAEVQRQSTRLLDEPQGLQNETAPKAAQVMSQRKRAGLLPSAWTEMCRHLPKMRMSVRSRR